MKPTTNILLWNSSIFLIFLLILFIFLEFFYSIKLTNENNTNTRNSYAFWSSAYPFTENKIYEFKPGLYSNTTDEFTESFEVNSNGYRNKNYNVGQPVDIIFYGDSFTFGLGVSEGERFSDIISSKLGSMNIANFAYSGGFTTPHYLLHFNLNKDLRPSRVYVFTYLGNDCFSDINETILISESQGGYPTRIIKDGNITADRTEYPGYVRVLSNYSSFFKVLFKKIYYHPDASTLVFNEKARPNSANPIAFDSGEDKEACSNNLMFMKQLEKRCKSRNSKCRLTNFLIPQDFFINKNENSYHTNLDDSQRLAAYDSKKLITNVMQNCKEQGIDCFDMIPLLRTETRSTYFNLDAHWNVYGHQKVADSLISKLQILD